MRKEAGEYEPLFRLESWRVIVEQNALGNLDTEATIKLWLDGERHVRSAEGNGPVNALDRALRAAIGEFHPELHRRRARRLQGAAARPAPPRHGLDDPGARREHRRAPLLGDDRRGENVIAASWQALIDALEYRMQPGRRVRPETPLPSSGRV